MGEGPAGTPHTQLFLSFFGALSWGWVKVSILIEEEERGKWSGDKKALVSLEKAKGYLGICPLHLAWKTENSLLWGKEKM